MSSVNARGAALICMILFLAQPIQFGLWLSRISEVQSALGLSKSTLAFALLGMPVGLLPTLYFAGNIVDRIGPRRALIWAFPPMLAAGMLPGLATGPTSLFLGLLVLGAVFAFAEVGLNVFAAQTEKTFGITIMNRAHGFWSLGIMTGSLIGVQLARLDFGALMVLVLSGCFLMPVLFAIAFRLPEYRVEPPAEVEIDSPRGLPLGIIPIILVVFGATITEGAMSDWATVYMRESPWGGTARDGLAVSVFAGMVTLGRFLGDGLNLRFGPVVLARACLVSAILGVLTLTVSGNMWTSFLGFGLVGLGVSAIFPLGVSATARLGKNREARAVSIMTFGALTGFLIGPPLIGLAAEEVGLRVSMMLLLPTLVMSLTLVGRLGNGIRN